jgi:hypothetical protein
LGDPSGPELAVGGAGIVALPACLAGLVVVPVLEYPGRGAPGLYQGRSFYPGSTAGMEVQGDSGVFPMIIHRLIGHHLKNRDDTRFYRMQSEDAIGWFAGQGVSLDSDCNVLDLGCGNEIFGEELLRMGCKVVFADFENQLLPELEEQPFVQICLDTGGGVIPGGIFPRNPAGTVEVPASVP